MQSTTLTMKKNLFKLIAGIAQLGERQTEDLKVPGSIPGHGIRFCFYKYNHFSHRNHFYSFHFK